MNLQTWSNRRSGCRFNALTVCCFASRGAFTATVSHFLYLKHHMRSKMVFDDTELVFNENSFKVCDWSKFYPEAEEAIPHDLPMERGNGVSTSCFVDADHAGCKATRRLHTGVLLFVKKAPII
jgi:hypothetical protein